MITTKPRTISLADAAKIKKAHGVGELLTQPSANSKLAKSTGFYNCGITLAQGNISGHEVCHGRGNCFRFESNGETFTPCLGNQGRAEYLPAIVNYRIARTRFLFDNPAEFGACLLAELNAVDRKAQRLGIEVGFRGNILSDLDWSKIAPWLFEAFPAWRFYDYTKIKSRYRAFLAGQLSPNYHLTMSYSERLDDNFCRSILSAGGTLAVPFAVDSVDELPKRFLGFDVIDGVSSDLRFLDPAGVVVGLISKKPKAKDAAATFDKVTTKSGFFVDRFDQRCR